MYKCERKSNQLYSEDVICRRSCPTAYKSHRNWSALVFSRLRLGIGLLLCNRDCYLEPEDRDIVTVSNDPCYDYTRQVHNVLRLWFVVVVASKRGSRGGVSETGKDVTHNFGRREPHTFWRVTIHRESSSRCSRNKGRTMSDERAQTLRVELKIWEKQFAAQNSGKRPSREDIKNNAEIGMYHKTWTLFRVLIVAAAKYREYDRLRRPSTKKSEVQDSSLSKAHPTPKKAAPAATPQKANPHFLIPALAPLQDDEAEPEPTPAAVRMHLGPTPQKDGQILSLFDDLSSTASKPSRAALSTIQPNANFTPSKPSQLLFTDNDSPPENLHLNRTPASSSKRFLLDSFVSTPPLKRKREDDEPATHATPSSAKGLSTPAFLRRSSNMLIMDTLVEEAENDDEMKMNIGRMRQPPFKKRGIVRSLSSIIQGLRKQEDDKLDEELEAMREMENADEEDSIEDTVQVIDSQVVMPLGPDRGIESDESEEEVQNNGVSRKPWKKKGLKRQTKRVVSEFLYTTTTMPPSILTFSSASSNKTQSSNTDTNFVRRSSLRQGGRCRRNSTRRCISGRGRLGCRIRRNSLQ